MATKSNNDQLHSLMKKHKLGRRDVARLVHYPIAKSGQCHAVNNWLADPATSTAFRNMPDSPLAMLKMAIANMTDADRAKLEGPLDKVAVMAANRAKRKCFQ